MARKLHIHDEKRIRAFREGSEWPHVTRAFYNEMLPALAFLVDDKTDANLKQCLRNYLVVTLVATIEDCLRNLARRIIDEYGLDVSKVVNENITLPISLLDQIADKELTKGRLVASNFNFADPHVANEFFSKLMDMDFLGFVLKLDKKDPLSLIKPVGHLHEKWDAFLQLFDLRNRFVHGKEQVSLSDGEMAGFVNWTMSFLEASVVLGMGKDESTKFIKLMKKLQV